MSAIKSLPKAELHVHLEGSVSPALARKLAKRHQLSFPEQELLKDEHTYAWKDFLDFLKVYDVVSAFIRTPEDYHDVVYDYLMQSAQAGVIYTELMPSPDHARLAGMSYQNMLEGIVEAMEKARAAFNIESRIYISGVRHFGAKACEEVAMLPAKYPHPWVTGFGLGGDEAGFPPAQFARAYEIAQKESGLSCTVHAGEMAGPESVWEAIRHLPITRIGHGVRSIEDPQLIAELKERNIALEVCPTSNVVLSVYPNYQEHPLLALREAGLSLSLNSDDPPYFGTTIDQEYEVAATQFGLSESDLKDITRQALQAAFVDEPTRAALLSRLAE